MAAQARMIHERLLRLRSRCAWTALPLLLTVVGCEPPEPAAPPGAGEPPAAGAASGDQRLPTTVPSASDYKAMRASMVQELAGAGITDERVLEVLRRVPRHEFVAPRLRHRSYENSALPIGEDQTISQPYIVALMTQLLELEGTEKVLEIGTGSGYQTAVLGELVKEGEVYTIEIRPSLGARAKEKLGELKRRGVLHFNKVETIVGDGSKGLPQEAPFDAILLTAAPREIPQVIREQLSIGGRMVVPVGDYSHQELRRFRRRADGSFHEDPPIVPTLFVPLDREGSP